MARARFIKPGFCRNEDLAECSVWARLTFALLPMLADREGRLEDRPKRIKSELFSFDSLELEPLLDELQQRGLIVRYVVDGVGLIQILGFRKHQYPHYREPPSKLPPHPGLRLDADGKYVQPGAAAALHDTKPEALPAMHDGKASGQARAKPQAHPPMHDPPAPAEPELSPEINGIQGGVSPSDYGLRITDNSSLRSEAISGEIACRHDGDRPALALVDRARKATAAVPACPHQAILALWAEVLPSLPQHEVEQWRGARADHLRARWREVAASKRWESPDDGLRYFRKLFGYLGQSRFLTGHVTPRDPSKPPFTVTLAWLVKPENWAKTIEGTYHQEATA